MARQGAASYDKLIFELSSPGREGYSLPASGRAAVKDAVPRNRRKSRRLRRCPSRRSATTRGCALNYGLDKHVYPIGSADEVNRVNVTCAHGAS